MLKNAIDWLSRPYGNGALKDKPLAVIGAALGPVRRGVGSRRDAQVVRRSPGRGWSSPITLSLPTTTLDGKHPRESAEVVEAVREALGKLAAEVS